KRQSCRATSSLVDDTQKTYHIATSVLVLGIGRIAVITAVPGRINTLWKAQISFHSFFIRIATRNRYDVWRNTRTTLCLHCLIIRIPKHDTGDNRLHIARSRWHPFLISNLKVKGIAFFIELSGGGITRRSTCSILQCHPRLKNASKLNNPKQQQQQNWQGNRKLCQRRAGSSSRSA